ncbi:hypothetical protein ES703_47243 [subsurface metagenome]
MTGWESWETWEERYRVWEKRIGKKRMAITWPSLRGLFQWFVRETERRNIDISEIDVESFLDPMLSSDENKTILLSVMTGAPTEEEYEDMYKQHVSMLEQQVREKYPEVIEPLEDRIVELERTETTSKRRYKKIKALELELAESERRREEEKQAIEAKVAPVKVRVLRPFTEGIIDYTAGSVLEVRDVDWILNKVSAGLIERVGIEVPVKRVPPPPPPMELTKEQKKGLEDAYRRAFIEAGVPRLPPLALAAFRDEMVIVQKELNAVPQEKIFEMARSAVLYLASRIIREIKPKVLPPDRVVPPLVVAPPLPLPKGWKRAPGGYFDPWGNFIPEEAYVEAVRRWQLKPPEKGLWEWVYQTYGIKHGKFITELSKEEQDLILARFRKYLPPEFRSISLPDWLKEVKAMSLEEYQKLSNDEKTKYFSEFLAYSKGEV